MKLRDYQEESVKIMLEADKGERLLIALPTGSGKTVVFSSYVSQVEGRTLIVVPSTELREQSIEKLKIITPDMDVGSVQGQLNDVSNQVVVATRQSLTHKKSKRIEQILEHGHINTVIIDEVHQAVEQVIKIIHRINSKNIKVIGLTATPWNKELNKVFNGIKYQKTILDMILEGYLCEPKAMMVQSTTNLMGVKTVAGEFNQKELEDAVDTPARNRLIVKAYQEYAKERKSTLVFCVGIEHLNHVVDEFKSEGIYCKGLDSTYNKEDRAAIIAEFKSGKLPVLVNCGVLTTGFDHEAVDCVMLARPTKSKILYTQIIGRGLRLADGKEDCLIIDINDIVRTHDLLSMSTIFDMPIKHGETVRKAITRIKKEKEDEEKRKAEEEKRKLEREKLKLEEMRIRAEQIKLFNRDMKSKLESRKYDFFRVDNLTYALSYAVNVHYVLEDNQNKFIIYNVVTDKTDKRAEYITETESLIDAITYIEKRVKDNAFTNKNADWKSDPATENQRKYCSFARTKGDAHKFFSASSIISTLKKWKREQVIS